MANVYCIWMYASNKTRESIWYWTDIPKLNVALALTYIVDINHLYKNREVVHYNDCKIGSYIRKHNRQIIIEVFW